MVAVLQWRYASQKMLRAIRVVLARIRQPLVWHQSLAVMHVHRVNIQMLLVLMLPPNVRIVHVTTTTMLKHKKNVNHVLWDGVACTVNVNVSNALLESLRMLKLKPQVVICVLLASMGDQTYR